MAASLVESTEPRLKQQRAGEVVGGVELLAVEKLPGTYEFTFEELRTRIERRCWGHDSSKPILLLSSKTNFCVYVTVGDGYRFD